MSLLINVTGVAAIVFVVYWFWWPARSKNKAQK